MPAAPSTRRPRWIAVALLLLTVGALLGTAPRAAAAPGDPFDPATPVVFVSKGDANNIQLFRQRVDDDGFADYDAEGPVSGSDYNALAFNPDDGYLYAIVNDATASLPAGALIRIGQGGTIERVGSATFPASSLGAGDTIVDQGAFNLLDGLYYVISTSRPNMLAIDVSTGTLVETIPLSERVRDVGGGWDIAYAHGYFWSLNQDTLVRISPESGNVDAFTVDGIEDGSGPAGAAWTFGNGNLGFSHNSSGAITQLAIEDAVGTPRATVVAQTPGRASSRNDGTNIPGLPTDLGIAKAVQMAPSGDQVTYTLTVTNHGPGGSSGWILEDVLPSQLSGIQVTGPGAKVVDGNTVIVRGGALAAGSSVTLAVTADLVGGLVDPLTNSASILGNEADPNPDNDVDDAQLDPAAPVTSTTAPTAPTSTTSPTPTTGPAPATDPAPTEGSVPASTLPHTGADLGPRAVAFGLLAGGLALLRLRRRTV